MLGGLFVALTPMVEFHTLTSNGASRMLMLQVLIGLLIGDGVGLGVELAELPWPSLGPPRRASLEPALADGCEPHDRGERDSGV